MERKTALVVDDDPDIRRLLRVYLENLAFSVQEAGTGKAAMQLLRARAPSLVCLDLVLPEMSGYEICEAIRSNAATRDVPVLVLSARSTPDDRALAEELGASAYLVKPLQRSTFLSTVKLLMGG
ncbi:MAG TPA: response regulator [Myxococcales bacterium]|nr:response regulator [Myxococcales bacterium]